MTHASVFSGIGGPEVAATMLGWDNLFHCEINPFGRAVLDYWYPNSASYEDITNTDFSEWRGKVDVLTGGFPCQPFSYAGQRRGAQDDRYLWPYMFRCIDQVQPTWVVAENVAGIQTMVEQGEVSAMATQGTLFDEVDAVRRYQLRETFTLERICSDLERHGYEVQPVLIPACAVGAPHRRDRVFIVARRIASDTDNSTDRRTAGEDEGKGREERIQERHEVRKPDQPDQVRREGAADASSDSAGSGEGTSRPGSCTEGSRSGQNQQPSERRAASEWNNRFYAILRHAANTSRERLEGQDESGSSERGQRLHLRGDSAGCSGTSVREYSADTDCGRFSQRMPGRECKDAAQGRAGMDDSTERPCNDGKARRCREYQVGERWQNFPSVSPVHRGNDGLPFDVDNLTLSFGKWRTEALKAYGNAIVPQVMYEIFRAIEIAESI